MKLFKVILMALRGDWLALANFAATQAADENGYYLAVRDSQEGLGIIGFSRMEGQ